METAADSLPFVDEHSIEIDSPPGPTWEALLKIAERSFEGGATPRIAALVGCEDRTASGPRPLAVGSTVPGFHVAAAEPQRELVLAGAHRFSRYALTVRLDDLGGGRTRLQAETRAEFPGLKGSIYRALVIGTRMHVLLTRRIIAAAKARAERQ
ncbi:MAG TPA: hypothetical protein VMS11_05060 [Solirubrobacterales bacterium]|nr:hypothetical protein [Solirubrobacterales bacterium]